MSINAEIDATVDAFVAELVTLVRAAALEHVRAALGVDPVEHAGARKPAPSPPGRRGGARATPVVARSSGNSSGAPRTSRSHELSLPASPPPARVEVPGHRGSPVVVPVSVRPAPAPPPPPVVVRRIPPKRTRAARTLPPPPPPPVGARSPDEIPAKNWVVVRRPARPHESSAPPVADAGAPAETSAAPPPPAPAPPSPPPPAAPATAPATTKLAKAGGTPATPVKAGGTPATPVKAGGTPATPVKAGGTPATPVKAGGTPATPVKAGGTPATPAEVGPAETRLASSEGPRSEGSVVGPVSAKPAPASRAPRSVRPRSQR